MDIFLQMQREVIRQTELAVKAVQEQMAAIAKASPSHRKLLSIKVFQSWLAGGGERKAGLPGGSLSALHQQTIFFTSTTTQLLGELREIKRDWQNAEGGNSIKAALGRMLHNLEDARRLSDSGMHHARFISVESGVAYGLIDRHMKQDDREIKQINSAINKANRDIAEARRKLKQAKEDLEGWDGFAAGFVTAITFSGVNKIKESRDKQRAAINTINVRIVSNNARRIQLQQHYSELAAGRTAVNKILAVDQSMAEFLDCVTELSEMISETYSDIERAESKKNLKSAAFYLKRSKPKLDELMGWISTFERLQ